MADRPPHLPNYPMPPGFPMNLAAMQQQKQQQAQPPHTMHAQTPLPAHLQAQTGAAAQAIPGGMPNTDSQRMWQQIQETHRQQMGGGLYREASPGNRRLAGQDVIDSWLLRLDRWTCFFLYRNLWDPFFFLLD